jgi:hypothetical protein
MACLPDEFCHRASHLQTGTLLLEPYFGNRVSNYLPSLASNGDPSHLSLPNSQDYRVSHQHLTCQTFKELTPMFLQLFHRIEREGMVSPDYPVTKIYQECNKKRENYRSISLVKIDTKILNKKLASQIQQHLKKIEHYDEVGFISWMQE